VRRLFLIGAGLMGSSFALAARRAGAFDRVIGYDVDSGTVVRARANGALDDGAPDIASGVHGCAAVAVAVPPQAIAASVVAALRALGSAAVPVFDLGSVKAPAIVSVARALGAMPAHFVPCHPLAGRELRGADAADAGLFVGRRVFVTPVAETSPTALAQVTQWWRACGADVHVVDAAEHDAAVAATSHLPHLLASTYVATLARRADALKRFTGPGFKDFTRIAAADPDLWRQILIENRANVSADLSALIEALVRVRDGLEAGDDARLRETLSLGRDAKERFRDGGG